MHAILAALYHSAQHALHLLRWPVVQGTAVAAAAALLCKLVTRPGVAAGLALLAGWLLLTWPLVLEWPEPPLARLPGAAVLLVVAAIVQRQAAPAPARARKSAGPKRAGAAVRWRRPLLCLLLAWWLRGAPLDGNAILNGMALFLGLWAGWAATDRLARTDRGWALAGATLALAGSLAVAGVSPHWVWLAAVPAGAALALLGKTEAAPTLAGGLCVVAASAIVASDRGRFVPADVACLVPLLALFLAPRLLRRYPPAGAALAAGLAIGITYIARSGLPALR